MTRGFRITMADDDDKFLFITQHLLSQAFPGTSFAAFTNAEDALHHILNSGTDLLITNHGMGRMSGTELIKILREKDYKIPIIMVSGNQDAEAEAMEAGANEFLNKNLILKHLVKRAEKYLFREDQK